MFVCLRNFLSISAPLAGSAAEDHGEGSGATRGRVTPPASRATRQLQRARTRSIFAVVAICGGILLLHGTEYHLEGLQHQRQQRFFTESRAQPLDLQRRGTLSQRLAAEADTARRWQTAIASALVLLVIGGGASLSFAVLRIFASLELRRAETHRQNLELESIHLAEIKLRKDLDRERSMLRLILATIPQAVYWKDRDGVILGCNDAFAGLMHCESPLDLIGTGGAPTRPHDKASACRREDDQQVVDSGRPRLDCEEQYVDALGDQRLLLTSKVPLLGESGRITGMLGTSIDITDRKELQRQLNHSHKLESIGQLAAGIAHEINTPTQFVAENIRFLCDAVDKLRRVNQAQAQMLVDKDNPLRWEQRIARLEELLQEADYDFIDAEAPAALTESLEGLERIGEIVVAMRELSHPGDAEARPFDLNRVVSTSATPCRNRWKYVARLELDLGESLPPIAGHSGSLGQVLINLIVNASDAVQQRYPAEPGRGLRGEITLATRRVGNWIEIDVTDNGPGIPEEVQDRVFDPFFTTKRVGEGTGQGLAIAQQVVVQQHHGNIEIKTLPSGGARFRLRLPIHQPMAKAA